MSDTAEQTAATVAGDASSALPLTADVVMDRAGVFDLMAVKELILRDEGLTELDEGCAQSLASLEILSLSHNRLSSLQYFQHFVNLIELNVNFNQITSLESLQCAGLEKLFVANNQITDISPLRNLLKLNTISLYGNLLTDLDAALHTCRGLPKLRSLDLGGNLCSRETDGYKFRVVRVLSRLKALDGDQITQLDKDLAEDFAVNSHKGASQFSNSGSNSVRPFTAPAAAGTRGLPSSETLGNRQTGGTDYDPFASKLMPRGNVRLFRDDFLNNHPILLEYLVQDANDTSPLAAESAISQTQRKFANDRGDAKTHTSPATSVSSRGFVDRMRGANPGGVEAETIEAEKNVTDSTKEVKPIADGSLGIPSPRLTPSPSVTTTHLNVDPSDPNTTIRKLLRHIEILMETLATHKNHQLDANSALLLEENRQLQTENNNIPILQEQVEDLKKRLAVFEGDSHTTRSMEMNRVMELENENASLKRENARLTCLLQRQKQGKDSKVSKSTRPSARSVHDSETRNQEEDAPEPQRLSHSELLDDSASIDVELTELILQNEVSLELIRNDIKNTKREWEQKFHQAKEAERSRVRPQTSLGLGAHSTKAQASLDAPLSTSRIGAARARQLHTSAGFRTGPDAHMLTQSAVHPLTGISEDGGGNGSTTNILTL